jgi:REP element-mobilizing transposase RayT
VPQSLANVLLHVVFSTKHRTSFLASQDVREEMNAYQIGTLRNLRCPSLIVNCVSDHLHCLCQLARTITVAKLVEEMKTSSSAWVKTRFPRLDKFHWQNGYGAFSVGPAQVESLKVYIANQDEHHRKTTYQDEFRELLRQHGMGWDERFVWD